MVEYLAIALIYFGFVFILPFMLLCIIDFLVCIIYHKKSLVIRLFKNSL